MLAVSAHTIQKLDDIAINRLGIPSLYLMENAGRMSADKIVKYAKRSGKSKVCVVCGMGNNAGDGFVIARYLFNAGLAVEILHCGTLQHLKKDAHFNYDTCRKLKIKIHTFKAMTPLVERHIAASQIIVDALFGVGLNREIKSPYKELIEYINSLANYVFSVDVPSGIDATTGSIYGVAVRANRTITFTCAKTGLIKGDGKDCAGRVTVVGIGIPKEIIKEICT